MKLFRKEKKLHRELKGLTRTEALTSIPHRAPSSHWTVLESGDILIEYPINLRPFFVQLANRFNKGQLQTPTKKLQLDSMGSRVWQLIDGEKEIKTVIKEFAEMSGLSVQEAEISVTTFLRELGRRGLILMS